MPPRKANPSPPPKPKWSFLGVYEADIWHPLFLGDVAAAKMLSAQAWAPNLEQDPARRKRAQGPTPNQEIGGWCVQWMYEHLTGKPGTEKQSINAAFLAFLRKCVRPLFNGEPLSSTYYRYYCTVAAAAVKWGDAWDCPEIAKEGRATLEGYLALLMLHRTPAGLGMPGARQPGGAVMSGLEDFCETLLTGRVKPGKGGKQKLLKGGTEAALWSLRALGQKFQPAPLTSIRLKFPLTFARHADGWLSTMPDLMSYDPCYAVSYVGGRLHELRWTRPDGKHKDDAPRKQKATLTITRTPDGTQLLGSIEMADWRASIPVPVGSVLERIVVGEGR